MTQVIETRKELDALDKGVTMRDEQGYHVTKNRDGEYDVMHPNGEGPATFSADEIAGEYNDGTSAFFPLTVIGWCWYCDRETGRTMYGEDGEDWSCMELHDDPR